MAKAKASRTLNPLHFEDLEPHRFEDLVRQLAYDFKTWRSIEAIGRTGSDEGMDIRAWETVGAALESSADAEGDDEEEVPAVPPTDDRLWVIQCKREKALGPAKVKKILKDFFKSDIKPYGYILAAATDFSKASRDAAAEVFRANGVSEFHLWGKGELEDLLVQPKNDNLLFAYFGISLQVRRRSMRTDLRSKLTLKRKLVKELGNLRGHHYKQVLIRDPRDEQYPYIKSKEEFAKAPKWRYWEFQGHEPPGHIAFVTRKFFAYLNWETQEWDFTKDSNEAIPYHPELWGLERNDIDPEDKSNICRTYWERHVPEVHRSFAIEIGIISYDRILLLDELGDSFNEGPHLLVEYENGSPFEGYQEFLRPASSHYMNEHIWAPEKTKRLEIFPKLIPDERELYREELMKKHEQEQATQKKK